MEENNEFRRRAFGAAGPVFLVAVGLLLLLVLAFVVLAIPLGSPLSLLLIVVAIAALFGGFAWGLAKNGSSARRG